MIWCKRCLAEMTVIYFDLPISAVCFEGQADYGFAERSNGFLSFRDGKQVSFRWRIKFSIINTEAKCSLCLGCEDCLYCPLRRCQFDYFLCQYRVDSHLLKLSRLSSCPTKSRAQRIGFVLKGLDLVFCKINTAKVAVSHGSILWAIWLSRLDTQSTRQSAGHHLAGCAPVRARRLFGKQCSLKFPLLDCRKVYEEQPRYHDNQDGVLSLCSRHFCLKSWN